MTLFTPNERAIMQIQGLSAVVSNMLYFAISEQKFQPRLSQEIVPKMKHITLEVCKRNISW